MGQPAPRRSKTAEATDSVTDAETIAADAELGTVTLSETTTGFSPVAIAISTTVRDKAAPVAESGAPAAAAAAVVA